MKKLTMSNRVNRYSASTGIHGDFFREIIWRLENSVQTPIAPLLIVRGYSLINAPKKWRIFDLRSYVFTNSIYWLHFSVAATNLL